MVTKMYDVLIIGAGPAGLGAAVYAARAGLSMAVIDQSPISGGQVLNTYEVDNYLGLMGESGGGLSDKFREHADKLGTEFITDEIQSVENLDGKKIVHGYERDYEAKTLILATGATHSKLGISGEEAFSGMGVSYCATCDGAFFKNRVAAVVGGGDVAVEDAVFLSKLCKKVYLIHRRDTLRAVKSLQEQLFAKQNVEILWDSEVTEICGTNAVEKIMVYNKKKQQTSALEVNGIFIAVGIVPNTDLFKGLVEMDERGYIKAGEDCVTSCRGIYAAGDIRLKPMRQIITAVADGANAVNAVQRELEKD
ncbi:MAG: thioredoxin-disulfide reductase [Lachnospiraceae bacterium]|nr:thioredoxin-disulfide reductase [Lachnospiraceae bacterium]